MSIPVVIPEEELVEIPCPHLDTWTSSKSLEPRNVNNLTLIDGKTFLSTTLAGDILPPSASDVGFFHEDTRFLSQLELRVFGHRPIVLSASAERTFVSQIELTTGEVTLSDSQDLLENTIYVRRQQLLGAGVLFDRLQFENFNLATVDFVVELTFDADFLDVFQVRGSTRERCGQYFRPVPRNGALIFHYRGLDDVVRQTVLHFSSPPTEISDRAARWKRELEPLKQWELEVTVTPVIQNRAADHGGREFAAILRARREAHDGWEHDSTHFFSSNDVFDSSLNAAIGDFHALQIPVGDRRIIAAGIPWFATMFGRDSIIAAYQSLALNPQLAVDTLRVLADRQGTELNDWRDEEPGKILHEFREGEMTRCGEMPFGPYYGSVDATPLFLILLSETFNWTADEELIRELLPAAHRALDWIDQYGDMDGDGFVEYLRHSPRGLSNQGWKDSWDANMHCDGTVAQPPIAPVEVQGYVYDAKYRMASLLRIFGEAKRAEKLKKDALDLARGFEKAFWMPQRGFYAMALDGEKKQVQVISSNPGHLLFTRIVNRDRARAIVSRLMRDDMFSGWGWRTLSAEERVFNPLSYHRGSVWPHDNSIIAHGMALQELRAPALQVLTTLFQAAMNFRDYRLPELFCGVQRREFEEPVHYPVSCSPQAWASGAFFLMLTSVLGIRPSAPRKELNIINPVLPGWLDYLHLRGLHVGNSRVELDFTRRGDRTYCNVVNVEGEKLLVNVAFKK